nr:glycosyltransferase family 10 [Mucilaginibacter sp. UR6-11]
MEGLSDKFDFEESADPDFVIFGPYGNDLPQKGSYVRIGYYCENIQPDMTICDWAFGVPRAEEVNHARYKRIQWHGTDPATLIKPADYNAEEIAGSKKYFCNFLYSHKVPYREEFFRQLSKYKKVDAPGKSMNNMESIDQRYSGDMWQRKRSFLSDYKFTIAFENDIYPGYQTEKLYDAMQANSIPVYCGDPFIGTIFNTASFINATEQLHSKNSWLNNKLTRLGQMDFEDIRPAHLTGIKHKVKRKLKAITRDINRRFHFNEMDFKPVIERIIALDTQPDLYVKYLTQPWFTGNTIPPAVSNRARWIEIFNSK